MVLFVGIENEEGDQIDAVWELEFLPKRLACYVNSVCLRFIDPHGDTSFNQLQLPVLQIELQDLLADSELAVAERKEAERLLAACRKAGEKKRHYLVFYADTGE